MLRLIFVTNRDLTPEEVKLIKEGYDKCVNEYNDFLLGIKKDLMNVHMLKVIAKSPERYVKILKSDLHDIEETANYEFHGRVMSTSLGAGQYGMPGVLAVITGAIQITKEVIKFIRDLRKTKEEVIDRFLIEPFSLKTWDEL